MSEKTRNIIIASVLLIGLFVAYSNHFDNGFYFDDTHTINNNTYIRDISNIPAFFTDIKYYGTMVGNQGYNPILVSLNTIDYWMAGDLNPNYFHASIFFWYLVLLVCMFFFVRRIFRYALPSDDIPIDLWSIVLVGFFGLHAANAETINYIIMRSDSFSTLCILASFLIYQWPTGRKYHLYLITVLIGIGTKETVFMFGPMLLVYIFLFEEQLAITDVFKKEKWKAINRAILKSLPALVVGIGSFLLIRKIFIPETHVLFPEGSGSSTGVFQYFATQWFIIVHYIGNFILPLDLSADPDFEIATSLVSRKLLLSLGFLLSLVVVAIQTSRKKKYRPISFGICWFFLALAPTSSFHPLGQIANDHRTFFPYIGLVISLGWYLILLTQQFKAQLTKPIKYTLISLGGLILCLHAYGTYQRNEVWGSAENLWGDVAQKSPNNGRGLMNYGLTQMRKGNYPVALDLFERAQKLMPYYSYLHINMAILKNAMGATEEAETYFQNALRYDRSNVEGFYYYANWLVNQHREEEARELLMRGKELSPGHVGTQNLLNTLDQRTSKTKILEESALTNPTPENLLELSIAFYRNGEYEKCVEACQKAIEIKPDYADAYNNMCSAYILLNQPEAAIKACQKALEISPDFQLAKNNLKWAKTVQSENN